MLVYWHELARDRSGGQTALAIEQEEPGEIVVEHAEVFVVGDRVAIIEVDVALVERVQVRSGVALILVRLVIAAVA